MAKAHLRLVHGTVPTNVVEGEPAPVPRSRAAAGARRGPVMPKRPAAAVRKSLRTAIAGVERIRLLIGDADSRRLQRGSAAASELVRYAQRVLDLASELERAVRCERNRNLWRKGKPYAE